MSGVTYTTAHKCLAPLVTQENARHALAFLSGYFGMAAECGHEMSNGQCKALAERITEWLEAHKVQP